ncbi:TonB-dependent receptor [Hymenobacter sp. HSC-4F20]|uniref:SusC/RagA family TonB-linked outer membrane protein n=1 Tax=Hymenobacter sp. HSC-4F20 TaxID=2864135 RepID=UPI001C737A86|nr:TonB-dependent receptor [Hymenobacter sp. HSC-4F20]MBX0289298.1 TonB-dependent receptor [Hymenobacter sp. HSC-4F20]
MKKPVPKLRRVAVPALLCCLPLQPVLAATATAATSPMPSVTTVQADITVTGRIVDEKGAGLPGVNVIVKGTTTGTQTDADGRFSLTAPDNGTLQISFVGYTSQEVPVNGQTNISISLAPDSRALSEVVVVGYLAQDRQNLTSSVSSLDVKESAKTPVPTLAQAIQGRTPGVQVEGSGAPGAVPNIVIRGIGSFSNGSNPLYVVDGLWTDNIRDVSPNDIESVTVLKDASSTAVYGSRGANGVIVVTTKRGASGAPKVSFNGYMGAESIYKTYDLTNHSEWADRSAVAYRNAGVAPLPGADKAGGTFTNAIDTDWQKEFFQTGRIQDYNLTFSGGSQSDKNATNFLISGGYFNQEGVVKGPKFERYSVRLNSGLTRGRLKLGQSALLTHINTTLLNNVAFVDVLTMLPGIPVRDPATTSGFGYGNAALFNYSVNPVGAQLIRNNTQTNDRLQGSANAEFSFFDFLSYRLNLGLEMHLFADKDARREGRIRLGDPDEGQTYLFENRGTQRTLLVENTLNFNKRFGDHSVNAIVGYSEQKYDFDNTSGRTTGFQSVPQYYFVLNAGTLASSATVGGGLDAWAKRSYFTQATYDFKNRYLLTASFRRDGSSRFDRTRQFGNFGAASVGWRLSEEQFFKDALPMVSNLKLRASYGVNGNDNLPGSYLYQATVNQNVNYVLGTGQVITNGAIQIGLESRNIRWEERYTKDVGFDLGLLDDRITLAADYYISNTKNALVNPPLPTYLGSYNAAPYTNLGEIENKGFELALGYHENRSAFTYGADLSLTTIKNKVLALSELQPNIPGALNLTRTTVGQPISRLFLIPMAGIFQSQEEIDNYKNAEGKVIQPMAKPGDVKYEDVDGDGTINTDKDRRFVGNPFPKLQFGLNLNAAYKGVDVSLFFQGVTGNDVFNSTRASLDQLDGQTNFRRDVEPWTEENRSTTTPRLVQGGSNGMNTLRQTTRWVEDGSYLRLRNIQIGYTLPKAVTNYVPGLGSVRFYVTGRNVFTVTKYTGFDPETPGIGVFGRGVDDGSYPNIRSYTGGLQVNF